MADYESSHGKLSRRDFLKLSSLAGAAVIAPGVSVLPQEVRGGESVEKIRAQAEAAIGYLRKENLLSSYFLADIFTTQARRGDLLGAINTAQRYREEAPDYFYYDGLERISKIAVEQKNPRALRGLLESEGRQKIHEYNRSDHLDYLYDGHLFLAEVQAQAGSPSAEFKETIERIRELRKERNRSSDQDGEVGNRLNVAEIQLAFRNGERSQEEVMKYSRSVAGNFQWSGGDWGYYGLASGYSTIAKELVLAKREDLIGPLIEDAGKLNSGSDSASQKDIALFGILNGLCDKGLTYWPKQVAGKIEDVNVRNELHRNIAAAIAKG